MSNSRIFCIGFLIGGAIGVVTGTPRADQILFILTLGWHAIVVAITAVAIFGDRA
jgi:hypothetical protein